MSTCSTSERSCGTLLIVCAITTLVSMAVRISTACSASCCRCAAAERGDWSALFQRLAPRGRASGRVDADVPEGLAAAGAAAGAAAAHASAATAGGGASVSASAPSPPSERGVSRGDASIVGRAVPVPVDAGSERGDGSAGSDSACVIIGSGRPEPLSLLLRLSPDDPPVLLPQPLPPPPEPMWQALIEYCSPGGVEPPSRSMDDAPQQPRPPGPAPQWDDNA